MKKIKNNLDTIIYIIVILLILFLRFPYLVYEPGGTINVNDRFVSVPYESKGTINQTYVSVQRGNLVSMFLGWLLPDYDIVPDDENKIDDETQEEANKRDRIAYEYALSSATAVAYESAGLETNVTDSYGGIYYIFDGAKTDLKIGDKIVKYNNKKFNYEEFFPFVKEAKKGTRIEFEVIRNKKKKNCYAIISTIKDELIEEYDGIGVIIYTINEYKNEPNIEFESRANEMGSSGGLMLALGMYNALTEDDITHGLNIAGTGTIEIDGKVGEIGGVKYKILGAVRNKCDVFLVPEKNYDEAKEVIKDRNFKIKLIKVTTFDEALEELNKLSA